MPTPRRSRKSLRQRCAASARPTARCCWGRRWSRRAITSQASPWRRTFQLFTQLAGRSGRYAPGRVVVQTFQPDARPLALAANHDVPRFLADELARRRELGYPPFRHLVRVVASGPDERGPAALLEELKAGLVDELLGPAPLLRLRGRHRAQLVAKTAEPRRVAARAAQLLAAAAPAMRKAGVTAVVDVDPQSL